MERTALRSSARCMAASSALTVSATLRTQRPQTLSSAISGSSGAAAGAPPSAAATGRGGGGDSRDASAAAAMESSTMRVSEVAPFLMRRAAKDALPKCTLQKVTNGSSERDWRNGC